jgi:hypothetical protein
MKNVNDEIESLLEKASSMAVVEAERLARIVLDKNKKSIKSFTMAMGTFFFSNKNGVMWDHESELLSGYKELDDFIRKWDMELCITGEPMQIDISGIKITDW